MGNPRSSGARPATRIVDRLARAEPVTRIVDRLARAEPVTRILDPRDRRLVLIAITGEGERVAQRGAEVCDRIQTRVLDGLEPDEPGAVSRA